MINCIIHIHNSVESDLTKTFGGTSSLTSKHNFSTLAFHTHESKGNVIFRLTTCGSLSLEMDLLVYQACLTVACYF